MFHYQSWFLVPFLVIVITSCSSTTPTPNGNELIRVNTTSHIPAKVNMRLTDQVETRYITDIVGYRISPVIELTFAAVSEPGGGGRYLRWVRFAVKANEQHEITARLQGDPINRGTTKQPLMAIPFMLNFRQESWWSEDISTISGEVISDGTVRCEYSGHNETMTGNGMGHGSTVLSAAEVHVEVPNHEQ